MKKILILITLMIVTLFSFFSFKDKNKIEAKEENLCIKDCKSGDKIRLKDGSYWHIITTSSEKTILFSDANIDLEGNYLPVNYMSYENTGQPVAFDTINARTKEKNPYCIYPDLGCSAYEKNAKDVLEDSNIKKIIDENFVPKIQELFKTEDITVRLLKTKEFWYLQRLEVIKEEKFSWLYHSAYWLMDAYSPYSVYLLKEGDKSLSVLAPYILYQAGIRPVIELDSNLLFEA